MSGYHYDVFLSYLHDPPCGRWVKDHFLPYFLFQLGNALNRHAHVFFDRTGLHLGDNWPLKLHQALAHSRCLLAIWSPLYFQSEWCSNESEIMRFRQEKLGLGTIDNPRGLIGGVKINDGIFFPPYAKKSQWADFEKYFIDGPTFYQTPLHAEFQRDIVPLANDVAEVIAGAPAWSADWLTDPWTNDVIARKPAPVAPLVPQPVLSP
jgi:hypothetical protein